MRRVDLTEEGRALVNDMWGTSHERMSEALQTLDVETLRSLVRGAEALYAALLRSSPARQPAGRGE